MKFLVTSIDALVDSKGTGRHRSANEYFPQMVEACEDAEPEDIVAQCFTDSFQPRDGKQYLIVPIGPDVKLVTFNKPKPRFNVTVQRFW